jgi:hypothetical protein
MNGLLKSLTALLAYLGRGAVPVDGMYFHERARPAAAACGPDGVIACSTEAVVQKKFRAGYRVLM